jgi:hypothetical protein
MFSCVGDVAHMGLLDCSFEHLTHNVNSTKFLGLTIDQTLSWKGHILDLSLKLNKALKTVYFSYFHSIMSYGVIFWGQLMWQ